MLKTIGWLLSLPFRLIIFIFRSLFGNENDGMKGGGGKGGGGA